MNIYYWIQEKLSQDKVLWYKIIDKNIIESIIFIWNYLIILRYTEKNINKIRVVQDISFHKK